MRVKFGAWAVNHRNETKQPNEDSCQQDLDPGAKERKFGGTISKDLTENAVFKSAVTRDLHEKIRLGRCQWEKCHGEVRRNSLKARQNSLVAWKTADCFWLKRVEVENRGSGHVVVGGGPERGKAIRSAPADIETGSTSDHAHQRGHRSARRHQMPRYAP